jgi:hypothetical protein
VVYTRQRMFEVPCPHLQVTLSSSSPLACCRTINQSDETSSDGERSNAKRSGARWRCEVIRVMRGEVRRGEEEKNRDRNGNGGRSRNEIQSEARQSKATQHNVKRG